MNVFQSHPNKRFCGGPCSSLYKRRKLIESGGDVAETVLNNGGYKMIRTSEGKYVLEHRYIMERSLGRKLKPTEIVHHKNGIRTDNTLQNLELCCEPHKPHPPGQRVSDLVEWVVREYPDKVKEMLND